MTAMATMTPVNNDPIGWMRKCNGAACVACNLVQFFLNPPNGNVKFPNSSFEQQCEHTTVNLAFSIFTSMPLLAVHLQRTLSTIENVRKKQWSQNSHLFSNIYFQVTFSLPLLLLLLKLPIDAIHLQTVWSDQPPLTNGKHN